MLLAATVGAFDHAADSEGSGSEHALFGWNYQTDSSQLDQSIATVFPRLSIKYVFGVDDNLPGTVL